MKPNTTVLILTTLIVAAGAYWYFFTGNDGSELSLTTENTQNQSQVQFQVLASLLQPISFNTSIFSDPRFIALVDLTTPITPETAGRLDPFAPVPGIR